MSQTRQVSINVYAFDTRWKIGRSLKTKFFTLTVGEYTYAYDAGTIMRFTMSPAGFAQYSEAKLIEEISAGTTLDEDKKIGSAIESFCSLSTKRKSAYFAWTGGYTKYGFIRFMLERLSISYGFGQWLEAVHQLKYHSRKSRSCEKLRQIVWAPHHALMDSMFNLFDRHRWTALLVLPCVILTPSPWLLAARHLSCSSRKYTLCSSMFDKEQTIGSLGKPFHRQFTWKYSGASLLHRLLRSGFFAECHRTCLSRNDSFPKTVKFIDWKSHDPPNATYVECQDCVTGKEYIKCDVCGGLSHDIEDSSCGHFKCKACLKWMSERVGASKGCPCCRKNKEACSINIDFNSICTSQAEQLIVADETPSKPRY